MVFIYCSGVVNAFESEIQRLDQTQCVASSGPCCDTFLAGKGQKAGSDKATSQHPVHLGSCRSCKSQKKTSEHDSIPSHFPLHLRNIPCTFPELSLTLHHPRCQDVPIQCAADEEKTVLNIIYRYHISKLIRSKSESFEASFVNHNLNIADSRRHHLETSLGSLRVAAFETCEEPHPKLPQQFHRFHPKPEDVTLHFK